MSSQAQNHQTWRGLVTQTYSATRGNPTISSLPSGVRDRWSKILLTCLTALLLTHWIVLFADIFLLDGFLTGGLGGWLFFALFVHQFAFIFGAGFLRAHKLLVYLGWYLRQLAFRLFRPSRLQQTQVTRHVTRTTPVELTLDKDNGSLTWTAGEAVERARETDQPMEPSDVPKEPTPPQPGSLQLEDGKVAMALFRDNDGSTYALELRSTSQRGLNLAVALDRDVLLAIGVRPESLPVMEFEDALLLPKEDQTTLIGVINQTAEAAGVRLYAEARVGA